MSSSLKACIYLILIVIYLNPSELLESNDSVEVFDNTKIDPLNKFERIVGGYDCNIEDHPYFVSFLINKGFYKIL